jgi:hypothetical protein
MASGVLREGHLLPELTLLLDERPPFPSEAVGRLTRIQGSLGRHGPEVDENYSSKY